MRSRWCVGRWAPGARCPGARGPRAQQDPAEDDALATPLMATRASGAAAPRAEGTSLAPAPRRTAQPPSLAPALSPKLAPRQRLREAPVSPWAEHVLTAPLLTERCQSPPLAAPHFPRCFWGPARQGKGVEGRASQRRGGRPCRSELHRRSGARSGGPRPSGGDSGGTTGRAARSDQAGAGRGGPSWAVWFSGLAPRGPLQKGI